VHSGDLAGGFSDLEMTWLLHCAGTATGLETHIHGSCYRKIVKLITQNLTNPETTPCNSKPMRPGHRHLELLFSVKS